MEALYSCRRCIKSNYYNLKIKQSKVNGQVFNIVGKNFKIKDIGNIINKKFPKQKLSMRKNLRT